MSHYSYVSFLPLLFKFISCVLLQNAYWLSERVHLSTDSSYTVSPDDGVILEGMGVDSAGSTMSIQAVPHKDSMLSPSRRSMSKSREEQKAAVSNYVFDIQVILFSRVDPLDNVLFSVSVYFLVGQTFIHQDN